MGDIVSSLSQLGPALGSVVVIGIICWKLLDLFARNVDALKSISQNVDANTRATERMMQIIERKFIK